MWCIACSTGSGERSPDGRAPVEATGGSSGAPSGAGGTSGSSTAGGGGTAPGGAGTSGGMTGGGSTAMGGAGQAGATTAAGGSASGGSTAMGGSTQSAGGTAPLAGTGGTTAGGGPSSGGAAGGIAGGSSGMASGGAGTGGSGSAGTAASGGSSSCALPSTFEWSTGSPVISPRSDATHDIVAVKDPTVVRFGDKYHVYASTVSRAGAYNMMYTSFSDFAAAPEASVYYMSQTPGFDGYVAAPQLFYFAPQSKWYLVFQSGPPMYSTNADPGDPTKWTRPAPFFAQTPAIIDQNDGWLDFWVICDATSCHLFASDDHGRWYKSKTAIGSFPNGFSDPVVVMQDPEAGRLFEACNVYKVAGRDQYLALIEAYDQTSNWRRYFRSFTASSLEGPWQPLRDSGSAPFAGPSNVTFGGTVWSNDISHGEMIRAGHDQTLTIDPCQLKFLYQGFDPSADTSNYNAIPWNIGLLTPAP